MRLVPKKRLLLYKRLTIVFAVASMLLLIPLVYVALNVVPYQSNLLDANTAFLANDYELVISKLKDQNVKNLPQPSKYELAYSYVQGETLSKEQLTTIMGVLSLKSDERYLLFWIYNGQGEYEKSLDLAQSLGDEELIIYGVYKNIELVNNNKTISGNDKQKKLKELNDALASAKEKIEAEKKGTNTPK